MPFFPSLSFFYGIDIDYGKFLISVSFIFFILLGVFRIHLFPFFFFFSMVNRSEIRIACPSISFLFARLGGSLGVFPYLENFVF